MYLFSITSQPCTPLSSHLTSHPPWMPMSLFSITSQPLTPHVDTARVLIPMEQVIKGALVREHTRGLHENETGMAL
jgi:hypothetical protein